MVLATYNIKMHIIPVKGLKSLHLKMPREGTFWGVLKSRWRYDPADPLATALAPGACFKLRGPVRFYRFTPVPVDKKHCNIK